MNQDHTYAFGNRIYKLRSQNPELLDLLSKLLPTGDDCLSSTESAHLEPEIIDLDKPLMIARLNETRYAKDNPSAALVAVLDKILADHGNYIWIDASALLTPDGKLVLISGPSHSGKTTLTLAMSLAHNWKIVAEDIVLIHLDSGLLAPFARPLSLREDTIEKIQKATGMQPGSFVLEGWLTNKSWYYPKALPATFDAAIDLAVTDKDSTSSLIVEPADLGAFVRRLITHSNALHHDKGVDRLTASFAQCQCYLLSEGTPKERIEALLQLSSC